MVDVHVDADGLLVFVEMRFREIDAGPFHESNHRRGREDVVFELARAHCRSRDVGRGSSEAGCETAFHEKNIRESGGRAQHRALGRYQQMMMMMSYPNSQESLASFLGYHVRRSVTWRLALDLLLLLLPFELLARIILAPSQISTNPESIDNVPQPCSYDRSHPERVIALRI